MHAADGPEALTRSTWPSEANVTTALTGSVWPAKHACAPPRTELSAVLTAPPDGCSGTLVALPSAGLSGGSAAGSGFVAVAGGAAGVGSSSSTTASGLASALGVGAAFVARAAPIAAPAPA